MLHTHANTTSALPDIDAVDQSSAQDCLDTGWGRSTSLPVYPKKTKAKSITKSDLDAFMGTVDRDSTGPFANLRNDIGSLLKASMPPHHRLHFVNPFKVHPGACSTMSSLVAGKDALPLLVEISDCESDCCSDSERAPSEHLGNECLSEGGSINAERTFAIMTELMVHYDLETCLVSIRENKGERFFLIHRLACSELWRTHMFVASSNLSQLLVHRGIPTIIPDMSKDSRFVDAIDARRQLERFLVQAPVGWKDDGSWIGVLNLVGKQALTCPSLDDYDALMKKADEIASLVVASRQQ